MSERIEELCAALSLNAIGRDYANLADEAARKKLSFTDYLEQVLQAEHALRQERSRQMLVKLATFPSVKTMEEFDFKAAAGVPKARLQVNCPGFPRHSRTVRFPVVRRPPATGPRCIHAAAVGCRTSRCSRTHPPVPALASSSSSI